MPRINIKGGVWRNTEDEILKAAVMKYGKNQWARIASLLHRKAAKQCKARWYEWLDPSVKKTEWSREEDEKLLHLAKLMPTQWRTIAPIVGRTANQCLERYEYLLDKAQNREGLSAEEDPKRLRPGEIDPNPETKPARPDPIDMDEDELEMLSEARARLANTQGKKAKRKARERQLEIARRMAMMQKRRELRAAGLGSFLGLMPKTKPFMDYNIEIPFEKQPPKGFYDTSQEKVDPKLLDFQRLRLSDVEKETFMEREKRERKKDAERQAKRLQSDLPGVLRGGALDEPVLKRSKLVLPEPQVSDLELENLVKVGQAGENAVRMAMEDSGYDAGSATHPLLPDYPSAGGFATPAMIAAQRTPVAMVDSVTREAQNILALQQVQTPLVGGDNPELIGHSDFTGVTPSPANVLTTPNTLLHSQIVGPSPFRTPGQPESVTPMLNGTPGLDALDRRTGAMQQATPLRDRLNINADGLNDPSSFGLDIPGAGSKLASKANLRKSLADLPAPKNNYEIFVPDEAESGANESSGGVDLDEDAVSLDAGGTASRIADRADLDRLREMEQAAAEQTAWSKRSQVVRRSLPRPADINHTVLRSVPTSQTPQQEGAITDLQRAEEMIKQEMLTMMHYDNMLNPPPNLLAEAAKQAASAEGAKSSSQQKRYLQQIKSGHETYLRANPYEEFDEEDLKAAEQLLTSEMAVVRTGMNHGELSAEAYAKVWHECLSQVLYLPAHRRYTRANLVSKRDRIESHEKRLDQLRQLMADEAKRAAKLEKKLRILLGGYQSRAQTLMKAIQESVDQIEQSQMELVTYERLHEQERGAIVRRSEILESDVDRQQKRGVELQREYARLIRMREDREADLFLAQNADLTSLPDSETTRQDPSPIEAIHVKEISNDSGLDDNGTSQEGYDSPPNDRPDDSDAVIDQSPHQAEVSAQCM
ncbi:CDC5 cell division cycle 5-like protein [Clonorchis sinensis]|uniref:CDC5 cell division cycle 5-like protein n=1 Tax=Clonorchis sinensis TaxID=79923 RepID=A0A8T1MZT1_CLOSI|nr:CDC5 cell division cycle 5-like protein [Clonorchis sinensis]